MAEELKNGMQCAEFDALLADALDGSLGGTKRIRFDAHRASCPACSAMFAEVEAGMGWLKELPEVEPPAGFVQRVLIATSGAPSPARTEAPKSWTERWRDRIPASLRPVWGTVMQPRFAMSFAMAFFSITLVLNVAGIRLSTLKQVDLRPSAIVRGYYETSGRLVKYYENIRFVYELETKVRDLKRAATTPEDKPDQKKDQSNDKKGNEPDQRNYQNYSQDESQEVVASCHGCELVNPWLPAHRRLS
ncbi:MAG TPA: zf-HC2 domain-containing protein [Terriglobales bacterium]|nr:zf-HC2 domain-containing protein [Terriglobales bacterium]